ncbi:hypothetical protein A2276_04210 [candidate division WOR-1 bacterium RIFOXYA12_FULL_43_27]|uniref:Flagellar L-ring protein n=1 Tax=candidate division WOR-1 bacterium RIFOXYC2_FULL_46_14 TaxID=1802587 RepID=A0A1F4U2Y2_UNCSA|nr:MAG: hypothetical protein A2276_04210 [candidate division WOR-1 bacterium RIFOXYA12_FULL_43_27]OGC19106.1 MAG: hypothetical protein A2292_00125 [candidate division WOR-1 bacterium RIFOXYB2_FULL_46_45]OGC30094.1 MAG: hypothetical protein A2232_00125 [candidate division WOR-1 bacterium RIFOXYA2_FULL_46_56]OGC39335.1 MAG: hypothetical protein A2438_00125 [candidate division WOR-1 bacterium RIFOXYC2_FULL_46_14]
MKMTNDKIPNPNESKKSKSFNYLKILGFIGILILGFGILSADADSLWKEKDSASPYTPDKSYKIGDIITILVIESTSAIQKSGTDTSVKDDFGAKLDHTINRLTALVPQDLSIDGQLSNKYAGSGKTERSSSLKAKIAVVVTEILANGNLRVTGKHKMAINEETQDISVGGIIRSKDISITNTIYSYQVADADIVVKGTGVIDEAQAPGWLSRFLNWIF